jgi:dienelactone hydrolase
MNLPQVLPVSARVVCGLVLLSLLHSAPAIAAPEQEPDADVARRAEAFVDLMAAGRFDEAVETFDEKMRGALPVANLRAAWAGTTQAAGAFERRLSARTEARGAFRIGVVTCAFARATVDVQLVLNAEGQVSGLSMRPAASDVASGPPPYARPEAYTEQEVTAGAPGWPLPGTLTMPVGDGPFPAVVLVHGSGPQDREGSVGPNRVFRDIALGLATNRVAVLRYEKRSREHAKRLNENVQITVREEVIDDVLAGVALLRQSPRIDPARVFVLGHSLGGMLAPRIVDADPVLAGAIVLAGAVRPLEQSIVEQTRYLLVADGQLTDDERDQLMAAERLAASVRALTPADAGKPESIGGAPASYWLDLRGYNPPALASRLAAPFLILQGERDYQVTMADFGRWRAALESRANVTLTSYPALNHMFMAGTGQSLPSEYLQPGHVDAQVVADMARWITTASRQP